MQQQLAGLMGMQGMGMPGMVSCSICSHLVIVLNHGHSQGGMGGGMPMNNSQLSSMWGGMPGRSMQMGGRGMMEVSFVYFEEKRDRFDTSDKNVQGSVFGMLSFVWSKRETNAVSYRSIWS